MAAQIKSLRYALPLAMLASVSVFAMKAQDGALVETTQVKGCERVDITFAWRGQRLVPVRVTRHE